MLWKTAVNPSLWESFQGGTRSDAASRRLAAARIVTAIGTWSQKGPHVARRPAQLEPPGRWQDAPATIEISERREPTYGTMGKFLGY